MTKKHIAVKKDFLEKIRAGKGAAANHGKVSTEKLRRAAERPRTKGKLLFALDATASRSGAWEAAQKITHSMFDSIPGELEVSLSYHGGNRVKQFTPFTKSFKKFQDELLMIRCQAGITRLNEILDRASKVEGLSAISYIGDSYEEDLEQSKEIALRLKIKGVKLFFFQDKTDFVDQEATIAFSTLVDITGGAVMDFSLQTIKEAEDLLTAVALYSAGGVKLLNEQKMLPGARKLLGELK